MVQILEHNLKSLFERSTVGNQFPPSARRKGICDVSDPIDREKPHHEEMDRHSFGKPVIIFSGFGLMNRGALSVLRKR